MLEKALFEEGLDMMWRDFSLPEKPELPRIEPYDQKIPSATYHPDKVIYVSRAPLRPLNIFVASACIGKHLHQKVNPAVYSRDAYFDYYLDDMEKHRKEIVEKVAPANWMRNLVGVLAAATVMMRKNMVDRDRALDRAYMLLEQKRIDPFTSFNLDAYGPSGIEGKERIMAEYCAVVETDSSMCAFAMAAGDLVPIAKLARAPAADYAKYKSATVEWLDCTRDQRN